MKKTILTSLIMFIAVMMIGQTSERTSAFNYNRYGKLDLAKESIDKAARNEKTIMDAKTWKYRGDIYFNIAVSKDTNFQKLDPYPLGVAYESYLKATELDTKGEFKVEILQNTLAIGEAYFNKGVFYYNNKSFKESSTNFKNSYDINQSFGNIDTNALILAAYTANMAEDKQTAKIYYQEIIDNGFQKPEAYTSLAEICTEEGDTITALQTIYKGRALFPNDFNLLIAETNIYLVTDEKEKAMVNLEEALKIDNTNPTIFFAVGTIYDQLGDFDKAISAYENAIKLSPDFFDPIYNLGAMYNNKAKDIIDKANELPYEKAAEYDLEIAKSKEMQQKAVPYLEKALELNPNNTNTLIALKQIYTRLGMEEQLIEVDKKLQK